MKNKSLTAWLVTLCTILSTILVPLGAVSVFAGNTATFWDVPESSQYYYAIKELADKGILTGYEDGSFKGTHTITRAEMATILCRYLGEESKAKEKEGIQVFQDVPRSHWACGYVAHGKDRGIINGLSDDCFAPESDVTIYHLIKMLVCANGYSDEALRSGGYPYGYERVARQLGYFENIYNTNFDSAADRYTIAVITYNSMCANGSISKPAESESTPAQETMKPTTVSNEITLSSEDKELLGKLTRSISDFESPSDINSEFADGWIFMWYTETYKEDSYTSESGPYAYWNEDEVKELFKTFFGVSMPDVSETSMVSYSSGKYKIYYSNSSIGYKVNYSEKSAKGLNVYIDLYDAGSDEIFAECCLTLEPADNENGFIVTSKTSTWQ